MPHKSPAERLAYQRAYRKNNPDWQAKHREYMRGYMAKWRAQNPERFHAIQGRWRTKNRPALLAYYKNWHRAHRPTAIPRPMRCPGGLVTTRDRNGWQRVSGWREDAAQDRVLAELERRARSSS